MTEKGRKRRGHSRFIFFFILIIMVLTGLTWAGYQTLSKADWLSIKTIRYAGNENVSSSTIQSLLREFMGRNLLDISTNEVRQQLLKIKRIASVKIVRQYPSTLKVKLTERKGFLYVKSKEGDLFPIDENRMVMEYAVFTSKEDLPIVQTQIPGKQLHVGKVINDVFLKRVIALQKEIIADQPDFIKTISEYYADNDLIVIIDAKYGSRILLSNADLKNQLRRYQFVQENGDINRKDILDLRYKDQIVVRQEIR
jgi:cell division protein FtsQ